MSEQFAGAAPSKCVVWAISNTGDEPLPRLRSDDRYKALTEAEWIARQGEPRGAVSIWVKEDDTIVWAAGQKARELTEGGHTVDRLGNVRLLPSDPDEQGEG